MTPPASKLNLFDYLDYRVYLRDWYRAAKAERATSLRLFSKKAGFTSPNYLKLIMDGERNLSEDSLEKFMAALEFNKQERRFFRHLVLFNQAKTHQGKDQHYQGLLQCRKFNQLQPIQKEQYEFYSTWYHPVVRELVTSRGGAVTPEQIAERIFPPLTPREVRKSVELLERMGFIARTENGGWKMSDPLITTGAESGSVTLLNYHQSLLDVAKQVLAEVPQEQRDISALTLGVSRRLVPELKRRIHEFRQEILQMAMGEVNAEEVILFTMQLMPVTKG